MESYFDVKHTLYYPNSAYISLENMLSSSENKTGEGCEYFNFFQCKISWV